MFYILKHVSNVFNGYKSKKVQIQMQLMKNKLWENTVCKNKGLFINCELVIWEYHKLSKNLAGARDGQLIIVQI